jgi:hypothetical protein
VVVSRSAPPRAFVRRRNSGNFHRMTCVATYSYRRRAR